MQINSQRNPYSANQRQSFGCKFDEAGKVVELCPRATEIVDKAYDYYSKRLGELPKEIKQAVPEIIKSSAVQTITELIEKHQLAARVLEGMKLVEPSERDIQHNLLLDKMEREIQNRAKQGA